MDANLMDTFLQECGELLEDMEARLLQAETGGCDAECVHAIFRAAHTIKGSAGLFGLEAVVAFTHGLESVLDRVRDGLLGLDADLTGLLLACRDHLGRLVEETAAGRSLARDAAATGQELSRRLAAYLAREPGVAPPAAGPARAESAGEAAEAPRAATGNWHISLRFHRGILKNGLDPLPFLRYLGSLGEIVSIVTLYDNLPSADDLSPEDCYLGFELSFRSERSKAEIEDVFEFFRDDATIRILPPRSRIDAYVELIAAQPEDGLRLGQILVNCGTLTERELAEALAAQQAEAGHPALGTLLVQAQMVQPEVVAAALEKQQAAGPAAAPRASIRVDAEKLDLLVNLVGELVIAGAGASLTARGGKREAMLEAAATLNRLIEEVRTRALNLRMVQIGDTFNRFQRVVRDVSRQLGKDIRLVVEGAETELDKTVVERIGDPLMHLVRNAMDHGIETAEARLAAGKPAQGTLRLNAYHDAGSVVIEVADDGAGLAKEKILRKARERGIVAPGQELSEAEIHGLIFAPGFSTAEQLSELSGRGVGMDVVRRNIEALRGSIDIDTTPGQGTALRIRLPLTLAIIDGFLVGVGPSAFVIPLDLVVECVELADLGRTGNFINLRGHLLPVLRLREAFEIKGALPSREQVVVVQFGNTRAGLVVDALHGEFQTVIKPLGSMFSHLSGISGSTILGSGEVALILDAPSLIGKLKSGSGELKAASL